jgi:hypothetical protein
MAHTVKVINAIVCEDIRFEVGNKVTLVGVIAGDIFTEALPLKMPIAIYIELSSPESGSFPLNLELIVGEKVIRKIESAMDVEDPLQTGVLALPKWQVAAENDTDLCVRISFGDEWQTIIQKRIKKADLATLPPPSALSNA